MSISLSMPPLLLPRSTEAGWFGASSLDEDAALAKMEEALQQLLGIKNFNSDIPIVGRGRKAAGGAVPTNDDDVPNEDDDDVDDEDGEEEMDEDELRRQAAATTISRRSCLPACRRYGLAVEASARAGDARGSLASDGGGSMALGGRRRAVGGRGGAGAPFGVSPYYPHPCRGFATARAGLHR